MNYRLIATITSVLLVLGAFDLPYGYYQFLRIITCIASVLGAFYAKRVGNDNWVVGLAILAILFNPFVPIYLGKSLWKILDVIGGVYIFLSGIQLTAQGQRSEER